MKERQSPPGGVQPIGGAVDRLVSEPGEQHDAADEILTQYISGNQVWNGVHETCKPVTKTSSKR